MTRQDFIYPLAAADSRLDIVGGKGMSLAKVAAAGLPVPDGFLISTGAYWEFVRANELLNVVISHVEDATSHQNISIETASTKIQDVLLAAPIPPHLVDGIKQAYRTLCDDRGPVAVRSSATAEDLPGLSFAGQQDSFLNVRGGDEVVNAVLRCWASLWTARAIGYRHKMKIDQRRVAMAVVVQVMIPSDVAGILFTANPATGDRGEIVINANFGLGEAVVGGHVTPDSYIVDRACGDLKETNVADKTTMIVSNGEQGTSSVPVPSPRMRESSLSAKARGELVELSLQVEQLFDGIPQDIEWAEAGGRCWLLQSRPITNLPPAPLSDVVWEPPAKGAKLVRRQVVENMPDPLSPLFEELYLNVGLEKSIDRFTHDFGLTFDIDELIERPMFVTVNGYAYCRASYRSFWRVFKVLPRIMVWYATSLRSLLKDLIPRWRDEELPGYLASIERWQQIDPEQATDEELLTGVQSLTVSDANYWFDVSIVLGAAKVTDGLLDWFVKSWLVRGDLSSSLFLRGFSSKSIDAQADLETIANQVRADTSLSSLFRETPAAGLLQTLSKDDVGNAIVAEIRQYLEQYGHQVYTLDFVQPTQIEDPVPVLTALQSLVGGDSTDAKARQHAMAEERQALEESTSQSLGRTRRWLFQTLLRWAQIYGPHRESALFYMGAAWPTLRGFLLELGSRLVDAGSLKSPDDVFYLTIPELREASSARLDGRSLPELIETARNRYELREARKRLHPPGMVPEGSTFKVGPINMSMFETQKRNSDSSEVLEGFAVSPGVVTAPACVITAPEEFSKMMPGSILVCPTTTPAWTPLFAHATGLVTDIGGILAHGSIVAREYGIPAVMGTGNATMRVVTGQRITVDGDAGNVTIVDDNEP